MEERPWASGPAAPAGPARLYPAVVRWPGKLEPGAGSRQKNRPFLICRVNRGLFLFLLQMFGFGEGNVAESIPVRI